MDSLIKILYRATFLEGEGVGLWYEYLSKCRIYNQIQDEIKSVLIDNLPEKFGLGLDFFYWVYKKKKLFICDKRISKLKAVKNIYIKLYKDHQDIIISKTHHNVDLICNTEVLQNYNDEQILNYLSQLDKISSKYILFFIPNKESYAHPKFSGLKSKRLDQMINLTQKSQFNVMSSGYIDIPPWPSGMSVQSTAKNDRPNMIINFLKPFINYFSVIVFPTLINLELFYPMFIKKRQAHMIYLLLKKKTL